MAYDAAINKEAAITELQTSNDLNDAQKSN
jgi:hypothetical protein